MGIVDWNNDGVQGHEIARAGMIASHWMDESGGGGGAGGGGDGDGCGCLVAIAVGILLLAIAIVFNLFFPS